MSLVKIEPLIANNVANFTFGGLTITANAVFGNANLGNLASANHVIVTSNITAGNIGNTATYFYGNGYNLTGIVATTAASLVSGNSNVRLVANGNASISITGSSNIVVVSSAGVNVAGYLNATSLLGEAGNLSNIQAANVSGTVANANYSAYAGNITIAAQSNITSLGLLTGLSVNGNTSVIGNSNVVGNINVSGGNTNITGNLTANNITTSGSGGNISGANNISANTFTGTLTTASQSNITSLGTLTTLAIAGTGNVSGANLVSANYVAGTLTTAAQPNITSVGTLSGITSTGTVNFTGASNVSLGPIGNVKVTGGTTGQYLQTDGSGNLSWVTLSISGSSISNGNSNINIPSANGNINISAVGNANVLVVTGTGVNVSGTLNTTGNLTASNITTSGSGGNISGANNISANTFTGTLTTAAQPNITSLGTLTSLSAGDTTITGNLTVSGAFEYANVTSFRVKDPIIEQGGNTAGGALTSNDGYDRGQLLHYYTGSTATDAFMGWKNSGAEFIFASNASVSSEVVTVNTYGNIHTGNANLGNLTTSNYFAGTLTTAAQPNITSVGTLTNTTLGGSNSFTGGNLVSANYLTGTLTTASQPNITSVGTLTTLAIAGTGNVSGANLVSANYVTGTLTTAAQPNITSLGTLSSLIVTANITSGNANLGNVANANFFSGSGQYLTSVTAVTAGTVTTNAQPNVTSLGTLTSVTIGNSTSNTTMNASSITSNVNVALTGNNINLGPIGNIKISGGTAGYFITTDGAGNLSWGAASGGGGVSASGSNTQIQFNDNGSLGAVANLTFDKSTNTLSTGRVVTSIGANLGSNISNVYIGGGSANQILKTDGSGNLSWVAQPVASITVDNFTGDGTTTAYTLSVTPTSINQTIVNYNGVFQLRTSAYTLSGTTLTFTEAPSEGSTIEVTTTLGAMSGAGAFVTRSYAGTGVLTTFAVTSGCTVNSVIVSENGLIQTPTTDYTISGSTLTFVVAPANGVVIQIRELAVAVATATSSPVTIQNQGSNLTTSTSLINFTGSGVTSTNSGGNVTVTISGGSGGASNARLTGYNLVFGG